MTNVLIYSSVFTITEVKTTSEYQAFNTNHSQSQFKLTEQCSSGIFQN